MVEILNQRRAVMADNELVQHAWEIVFPCEFKPVLYVPGDNEQAHCGRELCVF